ncbi:hypothetical protein [Acinetobacter sp. ANC 4639]
MMHFDSIQIGNTCYQLKELTFHNSLKVAAIAKQFNEKRLSEFLRHVLVDGTDPLKMTVQERYALLVTYLEKQTKTLLEIDMNMQPYLPHYEVQWLTSVRLDHLTVRQLTGLEAEYLESKCKSVAEWISCAMALQMQYDQHDVLDEAIDLDNFEPQFLARLEYFKQLGQIEFNQHYERYSECNSQLQSILNMAVNDDGFVILGGTDDAPMRFCPSAVFIGLIKDVDELHYGEDLYAE